MSKVKYRVVQTAELTYEVQEYKRTFTDPRDYESYYEWVEIDKYIGENAFEHAKKKVDELVKKIRISKSSIRKRIKTIINDNKKRNKTIFILQ